MVVWKLDRLGRKLLAAGTPPKEVAKNLGVSIPTLYRSIIARFQRRAYREGVVVGQFELTHYPESLHNICYRRLSNSAAFRFERRMRRLGTGIPLSENNNGPATRADIDVLAAETKAEIQDLRALIERVETNLLTEFHKWAQTRNG